MKRALWVTILACFAFVSGDAFAQVPTLPDGAQTHLVVSQPEEIVVYLTFDPATVQRRLPPTLRFVTLKELAAGDVGWASDYLNEYPSHGRWGISFFEIVRMKTFEIDEHAPDWPEHGAAALWCARVASSDSTRDLGPGRPLLVLDFWMPDSAYAAYMREKGHCATYADVRLLQDPEGKWLGTVDADGLSVATECTPAGPITGGVDSAGMQVFFPPQSSTVAGIVRVAFAGHREQQCTEGTSWRFHGTHPLANGIIVGRSTFQFGYDLIGGAYPW
jgi:hypothetical protein